MKRRFIAAVVLLCIAAVFLAPSGKAAGAVYFSAVNNKLLPLNDATMPKYYDGVLYLPYSFFHADELGVYSGGGDTIAIIYSGTKTLRFDVAKATVVNQDEVQYYQYSARLYNGVVYVPAKFVCEYFGFMPPTVIRAVPADIVRVRTASNNINDLTFPTISSIKQQMQSEYDKYTGYTGVPGTPGVSPSPPPSDSVEPTYEDISVYLSFYDLSGGELGSILDALGPTSYKACFFVTADEIAANANLLRRAVCKGHTIGVWLTEGSAEDAYREYQDASSLLFEAAQVKTVLVSALGDSAEAAEDMAKAGSLVYWRPTKSHDAGAKLSVSGLTGKLSTVKGARESLYFACAETTTNVLRPFLFYLSQQNYSVRRIVETSIPVMTA